MHSGIIIIIHNDNDNDNDSDNDNDNNKNYNCEWLRISESISICSYLRGEQENEGDSDFQKTEKIPSIWEAVKILDILEGGLHIT